MVWDGAADASGNSYTVGTLSNQSSPSGSAFIAKHDRDGNLLWMREHGTPYYDEGRSAAVDGDGNLFVSGLTAGILGDQFFGRIDAYVSKFDPMGQLIWTQQFGTIQNDYSFGVAVDRFGNSFVVGETSGDLAAPNAGDADVFVTKFNPDGVMQWARQLGTAGYEVAIGTGTDAEGNVYVSGRADSVLFAPGHGLSDAFVMKLDTDGQFQWGTQLGTERSEVAKWHMTVDSSGNAYVTGSTNGSFGGPNSGGEDGFVLRIRSVPEPGCAGWTVFVIVLALRKWRYAT